GLNVIRVGAESFSPESYAEIYGAVDDARSIFERVGVTFSVERYHMTNAQAGGFTVITSLGEARELLAGWSGPDNGFIDAFIVPSISGAGFSGYGGAIPGPTSHVGPASGVV